ncbi:5'-3' exoribonuclease 2 like protein [Cucumispora dikerogammari]|nr:5'-3' exoribonuclease 2 like protein [Cucumispora dikerogammari]
MGIPSFLTWFSETFPSTFVEHATIKTDCLYIDFNALIHNSIRSQDGKYLDRETIFLTIVSNIDSLVEKLSPTKALYIATDGVAPRAKLNQQRTRRLKQTIESRIKKAKKEEEKKKTILAKIGGKKETEVEVSVGIKLDECEGVKEKLFDLKNDETPKSEINNVNKEEEISVEFDPNCISPGTVFFQDLKKYLCLFIEYKQSQDSKYKKLEIVYSDDSVPGEGEHKILKHIRSIKTNMKHSIYSPDSDLIILGLTLHKYDVHIIREDVNYQKELQEMIRCKTCKKGGHSAGDCSKPKSEKILGISITKFKQALKERFDKRGVEYNIDQMINDVVLVSLFVGNDFLPALPVLDVRCGGMKHILETMLETYDGEYLTTQTGINFNRLTAFMTKLAYSEKVLYTKMIDKINEIKKNKYGKTVSQTIDLTNDEGKKKYYHDKFQIKEEEIKNACYEYLKGICWVYEYYQGGLKNWDYFYLHYFAPLPSDICKYTGEAIVFSTTEPVCRQLQLLLVLPADSKNLAPVCLEEIFLDKNLYPRQIRMDRFNKIFDFEYTAIMKPLPVDHIKTFFQRKMDKLTLDEQKRNRIGRDILFLHIDKQRLKLKQNNGILKYNGVTNNEVESTRSGQENKNLVYEGKRFFNRSRAWLITRCLV